MEKDIEKQNLIGIIAHVRLKKGVSTKTGGKYQMLIFTLNNGAELSLFVMGNDGFVVEDAIASITDEDGNINLNDNQEQ